MNAEAGWFGKDDLSATGPLASKSDFDRFRSELQNSENRFRLANEEYLSEDLEIARAQLRDMEANVEELQKAFNNKAYDTALSVAGATISLALSGLAAVATTPLWIGVAVGASVVSVTTFAAVSFSRGIDDPTTAGLTLIGHANNRVGLVGAAEFASAAGKSIAKKCFFVGLVIDIAIIARSAKDSDLALEKLRKAREALKDHTRALEAAAVDLASWREFRMNELRATREALDTIESLFDTDPPDYSNARPTPSPMP